MTTYRATAIHMKTGCASSNDLLEIDTICINDFRWYKKADLYNHLKHNPGTIRVGTLYGPEVIPCISSKGEKYVKSTPNSSKVDNLLALPRR